MRFREIVRFELTYQLRRWSTWLYAGVFLFLAYTSGRSFVGEAREHDVLFNSPVLIAAGGVYGSLVALLVMAAIVGDAATRDRDLRLAPLLYVTPTSRAAYLGGRFVGVLLIVALLLAAMQVGLALAALLPGMPADLVGPFRPAAYLHSYFVFALPNAFVACAIMFAAAVLLRHALASYGVAVALFFSTLFSFAFIAGQLHRWELAKVLDFAGIVTISERLRVAVPAARMHDLVPLDAGFVRNRLLWLAVGLVSLALVWWRFGYGSEEVSGRRRLWRGRRAAGAERPASGIRLPASGIRLPASESTAGSKHDADGRPAGRSFGARTRLRQTTAYASDALGVLLTSRALIPFAVMMVLVILTGPEVLEQIGVPYRPTAERVLNYLGVFNDAEMIFSFLIPFTLVFFAGELVWRERDARIDAVAAAAPVPAWVPLAGKLIGLAATVVVLMAVLMFTGLILQARLGWFDFDAGA